MTLVVDLACMDVPQDVHGNYIQPDFKAAFAAGVRGIYLRKSWTYFDHGHQSFRMCHDPVAGFAQAAREAGLVVGFYLFPDFTKGAPTPVEQVANFQAAPGDVQKIFDFPVCLDVEFPGNGIVDTHQSQADVLVLVQEFVVELTRIYGKPPVIYSSHVEMHDTNGLGLASTTDVPGLTACPLWQKTPYPVPPGQPLVQGSPTPPHADYEAWDHADLWRTPSPWRAVGTFLQQVQGDCRGIAGIHQCDISYFRPSGAMAMAQAKLGTLSLKSFQAAHGLDADNILGLHSFCALYWS